MAALPPRQAQLLEFIKGRLAKDKRFPTHREMAAHMGWKNESSAADCLERLRYRGFARVRKA